MLKELQASRVKVDSQMVCLRAVVCPDRDRKHTHDHNISDETVKLLLIHNVDVHSSA